VAVPDVGVAAVVCERFALCSLGCGWPSRAASWLVCERWHVGMAVPEGGGCGLSVRSISRPCVETLCRVGDEVGLMLVVGVM
jgi:hypothetical protein